MIFKRHSQKIRCCHLSYHADHRDFLEMAFSSANNKSYLCFVGYHSKFLVIKQVKGSSVDCLTKMCMIIIAEYRLLSRAISDLGKNFVSEKSQDFCSCLDIHHVLSLSYNHQSNGQVEAYPKIIKQTMKKCLETNADIYMASLQIRSTLLDPGLLSLATLLFNRPIRQAFIHYCGLHQV